MNDDDDLLREYLRLDLGDNLASLDHPHDRKMAAWLISWRYTGTLSLSADEFRIAYRRIYGPRLCDMH